MDLEEVRNRINAHLDEFHMIQGFANNRKNRDVMEFLQNEYPDVVDKSELLYIALHGKGKCEDCGEYTNFWNFNKGFKRFCPICGLKQFKKYKKEPFEVHVICEQCGNEFVYMSTNEKEKVTPKKRFCSKHCARVYNHANFTEEEKQSRLEKIKKTNLEKYGNEWVVNSEYTRQKTREKWGIDYAINDPEIKKKATAWVSDEEKRRAAAEKQKQTRIEKYGNLLAQTAIYKNYVFPSGKVVRCQGYEPKALDLLLENHDESDILIGRKEIKECIGEIHYIGTDGYEHEYFPDIYIKSENKIIEVKCPFTFEMHKELNLLKEARCKELGFEFEFMILEK